MLDLLIAADDRTGALEVGAAIADLGREVVMVPWTTIADDSTRALAASTPGGTSVVDLGSRHLGADEAARRAAVIDAVPARRHAHKIDSALRGNWAAELAGRLVGRPRPLVVAAALPSAGRFVRDGVVRQSRDGRAVPVTEVMAADPRRRPLSSRPADGLRAAGLTEVTEGVAVDERLVAWLRGRRSGAVVCDLAGPPDLERVGVMLTDRADVLFAGTAESIARWVVPAAPHVEMRWTAGSPPERIVVVVGSRHVQARRQIDRLAALGRERVTLLTAPDPPPGPVADTDADAVVADLAAATAGELTPASVLVVIGGDTAAAVLGAEPRRVLGTFGPGAAISAALDGGVPIAITRAGSFGDDDALVTLVDRLLSSEG